MKISIFKKDSEISLEIKNLADLHGLLERHKLEEITIEICIDATELSDLDQGAFIKILDSYSNFSSLSQIKLTSTNEQNINDFEGFKELGRQFLAIVGRNALIQRFGLNTTRMGFNAWGDLTTYLINEYSPVTWFNVDSTSYFGDPRSEDAEVSKELSFTGRRGLKEFLNQIYKSVKIQGNPVFTKKFIYSGPDEQGTLSLQELLDFLLVIQSENGAPLPFSEFRLSGREENEDQKLLFDEKFVDTLISFLKRNPQVTFFELLGSMDCPNKDLINKLFDSIEQQQITSVIRLPMGLTREEDNKLEDLILKNRRKIQINPPTTKIQFKSVGIPERWLKYSRPKKATALVTQYEYSISTDQSITTDSFITAAHERMQQIENQQERQQELNQFSAVIVDEILLSSVVTRETCGNPELWDDVVGTKKPIFNEISGPAWKYITKYQYSFSSGFRESNPPKGFLVYEHDGKRILCYDQALPVRQNSNPFTVQLRNLRNEFFTRGSEDQFDIEVDKKVLSPALRNFVNLDRETDAPRAVEIIYTLLAIIDPQAKQAIHDNYHQALNNLSVNNLSALREIVLSQGPQSLVYFLSKLQQLSEKNLFNSFRMGFIDPVTNLIEFTTPEVYQIIDKLCQLSENEADWWVKLTIKQAEKHGNTIDSWKMDRQQVNNRPYLPDIWAAFEYFNQQLKKLNSNLVLPNPCRIKDINNIPVDLDRLLDILKNAADVREQLYNLEEVSLHQEGAHYAVMHDGFSFVSGEMRLTHDKPQQEKPFSYRVTEAELIAGVQTNDFRRTYFRYIGGQKYLYRFETYREIFEKIIFQSESQKLLALVAMSATHKESLKFDPLPIIDMLIEDLQDPKSGEIITNIIGLCTQDRRPSVTELIPLVQFFKELTRNYAFSLNEIRSFLESNPNLGFKILTNYAHQLKLRYINIQRSLDTINILNYTFKDKSFHNDPLLREKVFAAASVFDLTQYNLSEFIEIITKLSKSMSKKSFEDLLDALFEINIPTSSELLNINILNLLDINNNNAILTKIDYRRFIAQHNPDISFVAPAIANYGEDCCAELIDFLQDPLVTQLSTTFGLSITEMQESLKAKGVVVVDELLTSFQDSLSNLGSLSIFIPSDALITKFVSVSQKRILLSVNQLGLGEKAQSLLIAQAIKYVGGVKSFHDLNNFIARLNQFKELINLLSKEKTQLHTFTEVLTQIDIQGRDIDFAISILKYEVLDPQTKVILYQQLSVSPNQDILLKSMIDFSNIYGEKALNLVFSTFAKFDDQASKLNFFSLIERIAKKIQESSSNENIINFLKPILLSYQDALPELLVLLEKLTQPKYLTSLLKIINGVLNQHHFKYHNDTNDLILKIIDVLSDEGTLDEIAALYDHKPWPSVESLTQALDDGHILDSFAQKTDSDPFGNRDIFKQLNENDDEIKERIAKIQDLSFESIGLNEKQFPDDLGRELFDNYKVVQQAGLEIAKFDRENLMMGVEILKSYLSDNTKPLEGNSQLLELIHKNEPQEKSKICRLLLLAYLREIYFRTSSPDKPIYPDSTQVLAVIHSIELGRNVYLGIDTGQGKSTVCALQAAMMWALGHSIVFRSSDMFYAERDKNNKADFYHYIGAGTALIRSSSSFDTFCPQGINFTDESNWSNFISRENLFASPEVITAQEKFPISLIGDEFDTGLDDKSQFIVSQSTRPCVNPFENPDRWIYPLINRFVDYLDEDPSLDSATRAEIARYFVDKARPYMIADEIIVLRNYLYDKATPENKLRLSEDPTLLYQLQVWIESAQAVREKIFKEKKAYEILVGSYIENGIEKKYSYAAVLEQCDEHTFGDVRAGVTWGKGAQQLLHARENEKRHPDTPEFICEPERKAVAVSNNKLFLNYFHTRQGRMLVSSGSPGTPRNIHEMQRLHGFQAFKIPPHQKNIREELPLIVKKNLDEGIKALATLIKKKGGRPVLLHSPDIPRAKQIQEKLKAARVSNPTVLTAREVQQGRREELESDIGANNQVTVSTLSRRNADIDTSHPQGLLSTSLWLSSPRTFIQEAGRAGRKGKPGAAVMVLSDQDIQDRFKVSLLKVKEKDRAKLIQKLQKRIDKGDEYQRFQLQVFGDISHVIQIELNKIHTQLNAEGLSDAAKQLIVIKQEMLEEMAKIWHENLIFIEELSYDDDHPAYTIQLLSHVTNRYIGWLENFWKTNAYKQLGDNHKIADYIAQINIRELLQNTVPPQQDIKNNHVIRGRYLADFQRHILRKNPLAEDQHLVRFMSWMANSQSRDKEFDNIVAYLGDDSVKQYGLELTKQSIKKYLNQNFISRAKRSRAIDIFSSLNNNNDPSLIEIYKKINIHLEGSLDNDKNGHGQSRFRKTLWQIKQHLHAICPQEDLDEIIKKEFVSLKSYLEKEKQRNCYHHKSELKELVDQAIALLANPNPNAEALASVLFYFDEIYRHSQYSASKCALEDIRPALKILLDRAMCLNPESKQRLRVYQKLRDTLLDLKIKEPSTWSFFGRSHYFVPENNIFGEVVTSVANEKQRYVLYKALSNARNVLAKKFAAFDISFTRDINDANKIHLSYKLLDKVTWLPVEYKMAIHSDLKLQIFIPSYDSTLTLENRMGLPEQQPIL